MAGWLAANLDESKRERGEGELSQQPASDQHRGEKKCLENQTQVLYCTVLSERALAPSFPACVTRLVELLELLELQLFVVVVSFRLFGLCVGPLGR